MLQKRLSSFMLTGLLVMGLSAPSYSATFDFVKNADGVTGFENTATPNMGEEGERGVSSGYTFSQGGSSLVVSLRASVLDTPGTSLFPYFDKISGGPGGLGVCKVLTGAAQCDPGGDDNATANEVLTLDFGTQTVNISNISFSNGTHGTTFDQGAYVIGGDATIANFNANGETFSPVAEVNGGSTFTPALSGNIFHFVTNASFGLLNSNFLVNGSAPTNEFYLNVVEANPVPIPSAFLLFGTGLVGLIGWNYRRAKKQ